MQKVLRRSGKPTPRTFQIQKSLGGTDGGSSVKELRGQDSENDGGNQDATRSAIVASAE